MTLSQPQEPPMPKHAPRQKMQPETNAIDWNSIVSYEDAIDLTSTDQVITFEGITKGTNGRRLLDHLSAVECDANAHRAWKGNDRAGYVAFRSAARLWRAALTIRGVA